MTITVSPVTPGDMRLLLRFSTDAHDAEIALKIGMAKAELKRVGVDADRADPLINYAIELFCKSEFNFDGERDRYFSMFERLRDSLRLSSAYLQTPEAENDG